MKFYISTLILFFYFFSTTCFGQFQSIESTDVEIVNLNKNSTSLLSIKSDFVQKKHLSLMDQDLISKGCFLYKRPNKLRWEYTSPIAYRIIINGDIISMKDEEKVNTFDASTNPIFAVINSLMLNMINGKIQEDENFEINYYKDGNSLMVELLPRNESWSNYLKTLKLFIKIEDYAVYKVIIEEDGEDYTQFDFINRKINEEISDEKFIEK